MVLELPAPPAAAAGTCERPAVCGVAAGAAPRGQGFAHHCQAAAPGSALPMCAAAPGMLSEQQFSMGAAQLCEAWKLMVQACTVAPKAADMQSGQYLTPVPCQEVLDSRIKAAGCSMGPVVSVGTSMLHSVWHMETYQPPFGHKEVKTCLVMRDLPHQGANTRHTASHSADGQSAAEDATLQCDHTEPDVVVLSQASDQPPAAPTHLYTLRVIVHPTYQVPALYLVGRRTDGTQLSWEDVERDFPHWAGLRTQLGQSAWALVAPSDEQAPRTCGGLMLHPCRTADIMQLLLHPDTTHATAESTTACSSDSAELARDQAAQTEQAVHIDQARHIEQVGCTDQGLHTDQKQHTDSNRQQAHSRDSVASHTASYELRYLVAWLSAVVAPVLGLHLSPQHVQCLLASSN